MSSATDDKQPIGLHEAAERLGVHYMTAYRYVRLGRLPAVKEGGQWKVSVADLEAGLAGDATEVRGRRGRPQVGVHRDRLLDRLLANDERGAWTVIESALVGGLEPVDVHLALLGPSLRIIGERWAAGELSIADEHRATAVAVRLVGRLGPNFTRPGRRRGVVLIGSVAGDTHGLPGSLLADILRAAQYTAIELGADTPAEEFAAAAKATDELAAVCVSFSVAGRDDVVAGVIAHLKEAVGVPVLVGGPACEGEAHAKRLGADGTAADGAGAVLLLEASRA